MAYISPYLDGVPDSLVTAYIPAVNTGWYCNVVQYQRTGLANTKHNLTMVLLPNDPGDIQTPGLSVNGFIITVDENPVLSVLPSTTSSASAVPPANSSTFPDSIVQSSASQASSAFQPTNSTTGGSVPPTRSSNVPDTKITPHSSASQPTSSFQPKNSAIGGSVLPSTTTNVSTVSDTNTIAQSSASQASSAFQPTNSTTGGSVPPARSSTVPDTKITPHSSASQPTSSFQPKNFATGGSVLPSTTTDVSTVSDTNTIAQSSASQASSAFQPTNSTTGGSVPPARSSTVPDTKITPHSSASQPTSSFQPKNSAIGGSVLPSTTTNVSTVSNTNTIAQSSASQASSAFQPTNSTTGGTVPPSTTNVDTVPPTRSSTVPDTNITPPSSAPQTTSSFQPTNSATGGSVLPSNTTNAANTFQPINSITGGSVTPSITNVSAVQPTSIARSAAFATPDGFVITSSNSQILLTSIVSRTTRVIPSPGDDSPVSTTVSEDRLVSSSNASPFLTADTVPVSLTPSPSSDSPVSHTTSNSSPILSTSSDNGQVVLPTASNHSHSPPTTEANPTSHTTTNDIPVLSTPSDDRPVLSTPSNVASDTPDSTTQTLSSTKSPSRRAGIVHSIVGGIVGMISIVGVISLASWASKVIQAKKASKPGANSSKSHDFVFFFPPYLPRPKKEKIKSHQITLTLTPVDIEEGYTYQQVVWQRFNIDDGSSQFTARLDYDRAFGTANIRSGRDEINGVSFCDRPLSFGHAKPGRIIPLKNSVWANPLEFIIRKYSRITARNDNHFPVRVVLGSYIYEGNEHSSTESPEDVVEGQNVRFQSFVVMDDPIGYAETLSASFDLILRAYKTHGVEVGQILSPQYLRDEAVPLLGERGIRISKLPNFATWGIIPNESGIELKRERTARRKYFQADDFQLGSSR
ncbi:hypothetical protein MVEN_02202200 [Mycena venus]|uniref:Uncharacterized protein n=1 Tax=Mycena venus TaxID=2733690 RepID=A0A8H7CGV4_9AGAR|nr:hypothetical protein MVEN_02202200 [Mycena venus]